ncbi:MAG: fibronectin type III domain-containing protein [Thermodesulfobacteriota bacterium]
MLTFLLTIIVSSLLFGFQRSVQAAGPIIADHTITDISAVPASAFENAKAQLHIAYGHTSHGSQLITGMSALAADDGLFSFNNGGNGGALDLHDGAFSGASDLGNPNRTAWETATRTYLNNPANADVNVVIWSWCGQVDGSAADIQQYLDLMNGLELDYPHVKFVYMTGHLNGTGATGNVNQRNEQIRNYCVTNNKILFDFADIESFDPDGSVNYMALNANDNCDYSGGNWASQWLAANPSHELALLASSGNCGSCAHSQRLNCVLKGRAVWWLWARLAGYESSECAAQPTGLSATSDSPGQLTTIQFQDNSVNEDSFVLQRQVDGGVWEQEYAVLPANTTTFTDTGLGSGMYCYRVLAHQNDDGTGQPCNSLPSNSACAQITLPMPPAAPSNLNAQLSGGDVQLSWQDNSDNEIRMTVARSMDGQAFAVLATLGVNITAYTDSTVLPLHTYTYRVSAGNDYGDSDYSNEASLYVPEATVDPVTIRLTSAAEVDDAFLRADYPDTNYGSTNYLGRTEPPFSFAIKFHLPSTLQNQKITDARVAFYGWNQSAFPSGEYLNLYNVTTAWNEGTVTWNFPWLTPGGDYDTTHMLGRTEFSSGADHAYFAPIVITSTVQQWVDGLTPNNGMMLVHEASARTGLKASEYSGGKSYLDITYIPCEVDLDHDGDVDGSDLAVKALSGDVSCLDALATRFGR